MKKRFKMFVAALLVITCLAGCGTEKDITCISAIIM